MLSEASGASLFSDRATLLGCLYFVQGWVWQGHVTRQVADWADCWNSVVWSFLRLFQHLVCSISHIVNVFDLRIYVRSLFGRLYHWHGHAHQLLHARAWSQSLMHLRSLKPSDLFKKQVRAFPGLTGYYRRFIPDFASAATPLSDLTRKSAPEKVVWATQCNRAFTELKRRLCSEPILKSPDFDRPFVLQTDASDRGIGAVLSQTDADGLEHPVAYFSRKLLPHKEKYATIEMECLAIKLVVEAFSVYLLGRHFMIQTDHRSLEWLDRLKGSNAKFTWWSLALQLYHFTIKHHPEGQNNNVDTLSRAF